MIIAKQGQRDVLTTQEILVPSHKKPPHTSSFSLHEKTPSFKLPSKTLTVGGKAVFHED